MTGYKQPKRSLFGSGLLEPTGIVPRWLCTGFRKPNPIREKSYPCAFKWQDLQTPTEWNVFCIFWDPNQAVAPLNWSKPRPIGTRWRSSACTGMKFRDPASTGRVWLTTFSATIKLFAGDKFYWLEANRNCDEKIWHAGNPGQQPSTFWFCPALGQCGSGKM